MARSAKAGGKSSAATTRKSRSAKGRITAKAKRSVRPAPRVKRSTALEIELQETRDQQAATAMFRNWWGDSVRQERCQLGMRRFFVIMHEPRVASHVGGQYR